MNYLKITNNKHAAREMIKKHCNKSTTTRKRGGAEEFSSEIKLVLEFNPRE